MGLLSFEGTLCSSTLFTFLLVSIIHIFYGLLVLHLDSFMFLYISHFCCTTNHDLHSSVLYNAATTVQSSTLSPSPPRSRGSVARTCHTCTVEPSPINFSRKKYCRVHMLLPSFAHKQRGRPIYFKLTCLCFVKDIILQPGGRFR